MREQVVDEGAGGGGEQVVDEGEVVAEVHWR